MQDKQPLMDEMSERHALRLSPGEGLVGLSVFQIDQPHQSTLTNLATLATKDIRGESGICGSAIFRGTAGRDLAIFTQWMDQGAYDQAPQTLLKPPEQDLYQIAIVDHMTGQGTSQLALEEGFFHFINVFSLRPGKRAAFIDFIARTLPIVRAQPGYISTNMLISLDARHAANIGQFRTRQHWLAMSRRPRVLLAFSQGLRRRIVKRLPRFRVYDLVAVSMSPSTQLERPEFEGAARAEDRLSSSQMGAKEISPRALENR